MTTGRNPSRADGKRLGGQDARVQNGGYIFNGGMFGHTPDYDRRDEMIMAAMEGNKIDYRMANSGQIILYRNLPFWMSL